MSATGTILAASEPDNGNSTTGANGLNPSKSRMEELASQVQENTSIVSHFLRSNGHPIPSFEKNGPASTLPDAAPSEIHAARQALMGAAFQMFQLAAGPSEYLPHMGANYQSIACLRWLTHFGVLNLVPLDGSISYGSLAAAAGVSERQLKTIARMAMANQLFCEPEPNCIAHTAVSALLARDSSFHDWASFMCEGSVPTASKLVEATEKWPGSVENNQTAYNIAFDTDLPFFDHLGTQPEKMRQFAAYMKNVQSSEGVAMHHLLRGFDWEGLGKATVVDVGGSTGAASIALAREFPGLNFLVQDLSQNATNGQTALAKMKSDENDIVSRISFQAHSFFDVQTFHGADVYLLRMILHDWPQREATRILQNIIPALKPSSRILIMDTVLPAPGSVPAPQERLLRARDMTMLQAFNSMERDMQDWKDLLAAADNRLTIKKVVQPPGSVMSVLEVALTIDGTVV